MVTIKYRLIGSADVKTKQFKDRLEFAQWELTQDYSGSNGIVILEIESTGTEALKRLYG